MQQNFTSHKKNTNIRFAIVVQQISVNHLIFNRFLIVSTKQLISNCSLICVILENEFAKRNS